MAGRAGLVFLMASSIITTSATDLCDVADRVRSYEACAATPNCQWCVGSGLVPARPICVSSVGATFIPGAVYSCGVTPHVTAATSRVGGWPRFEYCKQCPLALLNGDGEWGDCSDPYKCVEEVSYYMSVVSNAKAGCYTVATMQCAPDAYDCLVGKRDECDAVVAKWGGRSPQQYCLDQIFCD
jgi:hypothetical protein